MKTRLPMIFSITILLSLLLSACGINIVRGSGHIRSESRSVSDFSAVDFPGFGELTIIQGETEELTIETDDNLLPYIKSTVSRGTLTLRFDDSAWVPILRPTEAIRYTLTVKTLVDLDLSGAGTVYAEQLTGDRLVLSESGAGKITIDRLTTDDLTVEMSGAGTVELAGTVTNQSVKMSGLGAYNAGDLESQTASVNLSGAGAATLWVHERLDANLSGAGSISYYGSPQTNTNSSGVGRVRSLGAK